MTDNNTISPNALRMPQVDKENTGQIASFIWNKLSGEDHKGKAESLSKLIDALRTERDEAKPKPTSARGTRKTEEQVIEAIMDKQLSKLGGVSVWVEGIALSVGQLFSFASQPGSLLHVPALAFVKKHGICLKAEQIGSRGKPSQFVRKGEFAGELPTTSEGDDSDAGEPENEGVEQVAA